MQKTAAGLFATMILLLQGVAGQNGTGGSSSLPSATEVLAKSGYATDLPSLYTALRATSPTVRASAAQAIAESGDSIAAEVLENAYKAESDPMAKVNIATAMLGVDWTLGKADLVLMCRDNSIPNAFRLEAIRHLRGVAESECDPVLLDILRKSGPIEDKVRALELVSQSPKATQRDQRLIAILAADLNDQNASVRLAAGAALVSIKEPYSADLVHRRLTIEQDPIVRRTLADDLVRNGQGK